MLLHLLPTGPATNPVQENSNLIDNHRARGRHHLQLLHALEVVNQGAEAEPSLPDPGCAEPQRML